MMAAKWYSIRTRRMDVWMDDVQFYVFFNNISVKSGRRLGDNERLCAMYSRLRLERFRRQAGLKPGTAKSVGQRLIY